MSDLSPKDLDIEGYTIDRQLGQGGFARVYAAHQPRFDRTVAVKVVDARVTDPAVRARFERECQALGKLSGHPNIVTVHDSGFVADRPWMAMEYLSGGSLADRIADGGPMPADRVLKVAVSLAGALETAHRAGVLHRDVKPENVMVNGYGEPSLVDFGIARLEGGPSTTTTGHVTASIAHAPPEVFDNAVPHPSWDTYALGSTMFTLLTGRYAFMPDDSEVLAVIRRILDQPVADLRPEGVPDPVAAIVERAMAKGQDDRFASALAMAREIQRVQAVMGQPVSALRVPGEPAEDDRPPPAGPTVDVNAFQRPPSVQTPPAYGAPPGQYTPAFTPSPADPRGWSPQPTPNQGWAPQHTPQPQHTPPPTQPHTQPHTQPQYTPQHQYTPQPAYQSQPSQSGWAPQGQPPGSQGYSPQGGPPHGQGPARSGLSGGAIAAIVGGVVLLLVVVLAVVLLTRGGDEPGPEPGPATLEPATPDPTTTAPTTEPPQEGPAVGDVLLQDLGTVGENGEVVAFLLDLPAGQSVEIAVNSSGDGTLDPLVTIRSPDGSELGEDDDGGDGLDSLLVVTTDQSGAHDITVGSFLSSTGGDFTITVTAL